MITERQLKLLHFLQERPDPITAKNLANLLNVSIKTVRNDIYQINESFNRLSIESKAGAGYFITGDTDEIKETYSEEGTNHSFEILQELINRESYDFYDLAERFFISESTLDRLVRKLNEVIERKNKDWCIQRKDNKLFIGADESQRRSIYNLFLTEEIGENKLSLEKYSDYFLYCDIEKLSKLVLDYHQQQHHHMNDFSTIGFLLHLAVLIERIYNKNFLDNKKISFSDQDSYELMCGLIALLEKELDLIIPKTEYAYIYRLYSGKGEIDGSLSKDTLDELISDLLVQVSNSFSIDFSQDAKFKMYLGNHLAGLYRRTLAGQFLVNPLIGEIKSKFPFIYNVTVYASAYIQDQLSITFPDDEIAYLALHFLSASETLHSEDLRRLLLVSPYGQGSLRLIRQQLSTMKDLCIEINTRESVLSLTEQDLQGIDLILTTAPLVIQTAIPIYQFSLMLTENDLKQITRILTEEKKNRIRLADFLFPQLYFPQQNFTSKEECITFLCEKLIEDKKCPPEFTQQVLKRENLSSTAFGNYYAIPHAIKRIARKNAIAVCSLQKSIDWDGKKVKLVLLLAFNDEDNDAFSLLFGDLAELFNDSKKVRELSKIKDFSDFFNTIT